MLTRDEILARKIGKGVAVLPDGSEVGVRALTRDEVLTAEGQPTGEARSNYIVSTGMTDPKMSAEDVAAWASGGAAGDLVAVSERIAELSGLKQGADKSGV
jgi:hypothetical protein